MTEVVGGQIDSNVIERLALRSIGRDGEARHNGKLESAHGYREGISLRRDHRYPGNNYLLLEKLARTDDHGAQSAVSKLLDLQTRSILQSIGPAKVPQQDDWRVDL